MTVECFPHPHDLAVCVQSDIEDAARRISNNFINEVLSTFLPLISRIRPLKLPYCYSQFSYYEHC